MGHDACECCEALLFGYLKDVHSLLCKIKSAEMVHQQRSTLVNMPFVPIGLQLCQLACKPSWHGLRFADCTYLWPNLSFSVALLMAASALFSLTVSVSVAWSRFVLSPVHHDEDARCQTFQLFIHGS